MYRKRITQRKTGKDYLWIQLKQPFTLHGDMQTKDYSWSNYRLLTGFSFTLLWDRPLKDCFGLPGIPERSIYMVSLDLSIELTKMDLSRLE
jgi:hypothetical protein